MKITCVPCQAEYPYEYDADPELVQALAMLIRENKHFIATHPTWQYPNTHFFRWLLPHAYHEVVTK